MTHSFTPRDPDFEARVRASFGRQGLMATIGARLVRVSPREVEIEAPYQEALTQQHGFLHAGVVTALADSACGYSALSLASADSEVLTVEYKVNFLAPAQGERFVSPAGVSSGRARDSPSARPRSWSWPNPRRSGWPSCWPPSWRSRTGRAGAPSDRRAA